MKKIKAFKGFNKDLTCRGFQYEEGKDFHTEKAEYGIEGFHAHRYPLDCLIQHDPSRGVFCEVELSGNIKKGKNAGICATDIKIGKRVSISDLAYAAISFIMKKERIKDHILTGCHKVLALSEKCVMSEVIGDASISSSTGYFIILLLC